MTSQSIFLYLFFAYMGVLFILQIYFVIRSRQVKKQIADGTATEKDQHLTSKATFRYGLFLTTFYIFLLCGVLFNIWNRNISTPLGLLLLFVGFMSIRKPVSMVRDNRPRSAGYSINLAVKPRLTSSTSPELIEEILREPSVIAAIKSDLQRTGQIGSRERWRLGLITPGCDQVDASTNRLVLSRTAILHSSTFFKSQFNNILVIRGTKAPMIRRYPGWSYGLSTTAVGNNFINIRDVKVAVGSLSSMGRSPILLEFLQEDGFPLKDFYSDGDPLTTERGGTIVFDRGAAKIIYPNYHVQRRLIDDEGNLIHMGLDENFQYDASWDEISLVPSVSERLYKCVRYQDYVPIVRYRSFPYSSDLMLPIIDTPLSDSGWADLFIDPHGKAKLFIARQKTLQEWYAMMEELRQLFYCELSRAGNHLLRLTKDRQHLHEYLCKKQSILNNYFIIQDWSLS